MNATIDDLPLDESADAAVLAQAKQDHAAARAEQQPESPVSLLRFAEIRHKARETLIKEGRLVDVLRADAALEGSVSDAEDIVQATLLKAGVDEQIADLTRMGISLLGRMFLGMGPSSRDFIETTRKLYGDERTPEQKAADRERVMAAAERLKVKVAKKGEAKDLLDDLEDQRMCGGIDKAEGVDL